MIFIWSVVWCGMVRRYGQTRITFAPRQKQRPSVSRSYGIKRCQITRVRFQMEQINNEKTHRPIQPAPLPINCKQIQPLRYFDFFLRCHFIYFIGVSANPLASISKNHHLAFLPLHWILIIFLGFSIFKYTLLIWRRDRHTLLTSMAAFVKKLVEKASLKKVMCVIHVSVKISVFFSEPICVLVQNLVAFWCIVYCSWFVISCLLEYFVWNVCVRIILSVEILLFLVIEVGKSIEAYMLKS